jgi:cytochrome b6-f complex iron-sulfur subunit
MKRRRQDLDRMVEAVLAGQSLPSGRLEPDEVEALRAAITLRAARPGADAPGEEFVTSLRRRISAEGAEGADDSDASSSRFGRRSLIIGAAGAVAAGVVGALAEKTLTSPSTPARMAATGQVAPDNGQWVPVALVSDVAGGQVKRFSTATTVGFVSERDGTLSAVSGACTHQGCLLKLNQPAGRLDCPCHRTAFGVDGTLKFSQLETPPPMLPQIQVRSRNGQVEAFLAQEA